MSYSVHHLPLQHILELRPDLIGRLSLERVRQTREGVAVAAAQGKSKSDLIVQCIEGSEGRDELGKQRERFLVVQLESLLEDFLQG